MKKFFLYLIIFFSLVGLSSTEKPQKKLKIITTLNVLAKLCEEIGKVEVFCKALLDANSDPHTISEKPTFKLILKDADGFIEIGRDLEPWAKAVLLSSNNQKLLNAKLVASNNISNLGVAKDLSRKAGDIHASGNPHVWLSPYNALKMAENIKNFLSILKPEKKAYFEENYKIFKEKISKAFFGEKIFNNLKTNLDFLWRLYEGNRLNAYLETKKIKIDEGWLKLGSSINYTIIAFHDTWPYFQKDFPLNIVGHFEEFPGSSPSIRHINMLKKIGLEKNVRLLLVESYNLSKKKEIEKFSKDIKSKVVFLTIDCMENENYFDFINRILNTLKNI